MINSRDSVDQQDMLKPLLANTSLTCQAIGILPRRSSVIPNRARFYQILCQPRGSPSSPTVLQHQSQSATLCLMSPVPSTVTSATTGSHHSSHVTYIKSACEKTDFFLFLTIFSNSLHFTLLSSRTTHHVEDPSYLWLQSYALRS